MQHFKKHHFIHKGIFTVAVLAAALVAVPAAYAATTSNSQLSQQITAGVISTDIRDASNAIVAAPSFAMTATTVSTAQQTSTGTFGTNAQRISVDNPGGANNGWTLALNATVPGTGTWTNGTNTYTYNGTAATGALTVNPTPGVITANTGTTANITKGTQATFTGTTPITLMTASAAASQIWNGYLTGVGLSQTIPAAQPAGTYTLNMTQTVTAS